MPSKATPPRWIGAAAATVVLLLMGVAGYALYLHAGTLLAQGRGLPPALILVLAVVGGAASFFSPCSIAITPAFLAYLTTGSPPTQAPQAHDASAAVMRAAGLVALGIVGFYAIAGAAIGMVGNLAYNYLIYFIPVVGVAFILLGGLILFERSGVFAAVTRLNPFNRPYAQREATPVASTARRTRALVGFGFAYGAASHTCSLPIFLGILLLPLVAGNYVLATLAVFAYGAAIAALLMVMMLLGQSVFAALRRAGAWLMRATALLFLATGGFLLMYFGQNYGAVFSGAQAPAVLATASMPRLSLTEGADPTGYPYQPRTLVIPAGRTVEVAVTDHVGGCLLRTIFEGLGPNGKAAAVTVPVGQTRVVQLFAPHPGRYGYHCGENMYFGTVEAR